MEKLTLILLTIFLISSNVKADCLPGKAAILESSRICQSELPEAYRDLTKENGPEEPEEIRCFLKCVLEHSGYFRNGTFTMAKLFKHIDDTFQDKELGEYVKMKKQSIVQEASKLDDDCDKVKEYLRRTLQALMREPRLNVPYCEDA